MGLRRRSKAAPLETTCQPYGPTEELRLHTPRFGGQEMSDILLDGLEVSRDDRIVEIWPSRGCTTKKVLGLRPRSYRGITPDHDATKHLDGALRRAPDLRTLVTRLEADGVYTGFSTAPPDATGLADGEANVVFAETVLTALSLDDKRAVVREAARLLTTGGRFGVHELCLVPNPSWNDTADLQRADALRTELGDAAGAQLQPMLESEWHQVMEESGLVVTATRTGPLEVPTLWTLMRDVGPIDFAKGLMGRALKLGALQSMRELSYIMARSSEDLGAIAIVAERPLVGDLLLPDG